MFIAARGFTASIFLLLSLVCVPAWAEHDGEFDSDYAVEVNNEGDDSSSIEVQSEARSILDLNENQLEQVITTTLELQSGEKKKTVRITVPAAIEDRNERDAAELQNVSEPNGAPVSAPAPVAQSSLATPGAGGWIAVLNPMRWMGVAQRSVNSMPDSEASNSFSPRKAQRLTEVERAASTEIGLGRVTAKPAAAPRLDQKIALFFERFRSAFSRAKAKQQMREGEAELGADEAAEEARAVGSLSPSRPAVYQAAMAPGPVGFAENGENPVGITVIAILGWLGFLFCVFLMYRLRFAVKTRSHSSPTRRSEGRKTWRQSYPHGETVVNPRSRK